MPPPPGPPRLPAEIASESHGVLTLEQLRNHGFGKHAIAHAVGCGRLERIARGVYRMAGTPNTEHQRARAATLALCHRSAVTWWGLPGFDLEPFCVVRTRPGSTSTPDVAILHRPTLLLPHHLTRWRGVAVTRPPRTLFDLAATEHPGRVERAYDTMWSRGLVTTPAMDRMLDELAQRGRTGIRLMRRLIEDRRGLAQPTGSRLERRFEVLNDRAGIPRLRRQIDVGDDDAWIGRMDFVGERRRLVAEIDSAIHHAALLDTRRDRARTERLEAAGWVVRRWSEDDLWFDGPRVVRELRAAWLLAPRLEG